MEEQPLISVIIPVYKAETCLPACLDSVLGQTYQNLEVILVDDGSPDNSGAVCDEYAARDSRVRVIHRENGGAAAARNAGLDAARGAYIGFVDADDYIEPEMYQHLYERLRAAGADMAWCGFAYHKDGTVRNIFGSGENGVYDGPQCIGKLLTEFHPWWTMPCKLCRAGLFQGLRFNEEIRVGEDVLINARLFLSMRRLVFVKEPLYHWIWYPASLSKFSLRYVDSAKSALLIWRELQRKLPRLSGLGCQYFAKKAVLVYENLLLNCGKYDRRACAEAAAYIRAELREARPSILRTPECGRIFKIKTCLITLTPRLYGLFFPVWLKATAWRRSPPAGEGSQHG